MKSCFPDTRPNPSFHHSPPLATTLFPPPTTISSLLDDLLLEILSCVPQSSIPSIPLVCRRWSQLIDSDKFYDLRRRLHFAVFVISFSDFGVFTGSYQLGDNTHWKTNSLVTDRYDDAVAPVSCSAARLAAIGLLIFIIGKTTVLRYDAWTGTVTPRSRMLVLRKKFAAAVVAGKVYVAGGSTQLPAVEEYDPTRDLWRMVSHAPRMR